MNHLNLAQNKICHCYINPDARLTGRCLFPENRHAPSFNNFDSPGLGPVDVGLALLLPVLENSVGVKLKQKSKFWLG
jgi:hypothetical protein